MSFNKIIIVGNLGRDPELKYSPQGTAVCNFSMATNEKRRDKAGDSQDVTTWFRVTLFGKQAENASKYLSKGSPIYIEGRLRLDEWNDRDGKTRTTLDVLASDMQFIGTGGEQSGDNTRRQAENSRATAVGSDDLSYTGNDDDSFANAANVGDDDIPF